MTLPPGYRVEFGGQFENLERARARLLIVVPLALFLIFLLLFSTFNSVTQALLVFTGIPLAAVGGVFALLLRGMPFSISAAVGFIALFGVAVLNGVVMVSYIKPCAARAAPVLEAVRGGRPGAPAAGRDDGAGGEPRLHADGALHRRRRRGAAAARHRRDRRARDEHAADAAGAAGALPACSAVNRRRTPGGAA